MTYVLAIDVGTTNLKAAVVDSSGSVKRISSYELPLERPEPGAAVHDPNRLFEVLVKASREAVRGFEREVEAVVLSAYLFGLLPVDSKCRPLDYIMTWVDTRPAPVAEKLKAEVDMREVYERTGCPPLFIYQLSKLIWLRQSRPEVFRAARYFLNSKDYVIARLLGSPYTERSTASATQLLNIKTLKWDSECLSIAGVSEEKLPPLVDGDIVLDHIPRDAARILGLERSVPLVPGVYDGAAVVVGVGGTEEGVCASNIGSSAMLRVAWPAPVVDRSPKMRFQTYYMCSGLWVPGGAVNNAGLVMRWFRDNFGLAERRYAELVGESPYKLLDMEAERAPPGAGGLVFLPFISGERFPHIGNYAKGVLVGLTTGHGWNHLVRALMEGVVFNLSLIMDALKENGLSVREIRLGGGGSKSKLWPQILADVTGVPVKRVAVEEAALVGSAAIAFKVLGVYSSLSEATKEIVRIRDVMRPIEEHVEIYSELFEYFKWLVDHMVEAFARHSMLRACQH